MPTTAWIGLGSNLGDRKANLDAALVALGHVNGVTVRAVSSYHETSPVGGPHGQGAFLNAAARLDTTLDPFELLKIAQGIEDDLGRVRTIRWGERTIDVDLLIFGEKFLDTPELKIPHPRLAFRRFALTPLAEIGPDSVDVVTGRTVAALLANLERKPRSLSLVGFDGSGKTTVSRRLIEELPAFRLQGADVASMGCPVGIESGVDSGPAGRSEVQTPRFPWIVVDDRAGIDPLPASRPILSWELSQLRPKPTLIVLLTNDAGIRRAPGLSEVPILWPESDKADAIVAEIVATCRAIEGE